MSKQREKETAPVEDRLKEFWEAHENYDSQWARTFLHTLTEFLPFVFEFKALERGVSALYLDSGVELAEDVTWTDAPEHLSIRQLRQLPIFKLALELRAYASYGLKLGLLDPTLDEFLEWLEQQGAPIQWGLDPETERTIQAAFARQKLDHSIAKGLTPEELAALAQVNRKSIMNLLAPGSRGPLQLNSDNLVTLESAHRWLLARPDFRASIWQQQRGKALQPPKSDPLSIGEPLFVPVASDGSWFSPLDRHHRDGQYYVGNGDDDEEFRDYWGALDFLTRAASPRWRFADAIGRWRIKTASGWERKARHEVEALLSRNPKNDAKPNRRRK